MNEERTEVISFTKSTNLPVIDTTKNLMQLLNTNSYKKGSWVLHMLRKQTSNAIFQKILQEYYRKYAGSNADSKDFENVVNKITGNNWSQFFNQWLNYTENPTLNMNWSYSSEKKQIQLHVKQLTHNIFNFPLQIQGADDKINTINITKQEENFIINCNKTTTHIVIDPNVEILVNYTINN